MSIRETILSNFVTQLGTISIAAGYESDVDLPVERNVIHPDDETTGSSKVKLVLEDPPESTPITAFTGIKRLCTMTPNVRAYVSGPRQNGPFTPAGKIIADIEKLIDSPLSLGSNVRYAFIQSEATKISDDKSAVVTIPVEIVYWYPVSSP